MADIPIVFSAPMVRALLDGRKTMTRQLAWRDAGNRPVGIGSKIIHDGARVTKHLRPSPWRRVKPGDRLWVREAWANTRGDDSLPTYYRADDRIEDIHRRWIPSVHMPRWASRLTLIVTATKIERLQAISPSDAIAEGCPAHANSQTIDCDTPDPRDDFKLLWAHLHGPDSWDADPEVVALTFRVVRANIDSAEARAA